MEKISLSKLTTLLILCFLLAVSCRNDGVRGLRKADNRISVSVSGSRSVSTKSVLDSQTLIDSFVVGGSDGESLSVEVFESDNYDLPFQDEETKGSVVDGESINANGSKFIVNAWLGSENRYSGGSDDVVYCQEDATNYHFVKDGVAEKSGSKWSLTDDSGNNYLWRNAVPTTFWSYYPETVSGKVTRTVTLPGDTASDEEQKKIFFTYSIGEDAAATDLTDIIFGYNVGHVKYGDAGTLEYGRLLSGKESIDVHFFHALPAIRFDVSGLVRKGKVIKSITLENLVSSGSCELEAEDGAIGIDSFRWTLGTGKTTVSQTFAASDFTEMSVDNNPATGSKDNNTLQAFSNDKIFFLLPQLVTGIKITIVYAHSGDDVDVTKSFVLDHTDEWQPGRYYTYRLSVSGVDLHVEDKVEGNVKSDLVIKNIGADQAYIRASLAGNWVNKDGDILLEWDPEDTGVGTIVWGSGNAAWTKGTDGFYYHKAAVAPGAEASQLFESYTVTNRPSILEDSDYLEFIITAQSVLADEGKASATAAWGSVAAGYLNN